MLGLTIKETGKSLDDFISNHRFLDKKDCVDYAKFWTNDMIPDNWDGSKLEYTPGVFIEIIEVEYHG